MLELVEGKLGENHAAEQRLETAPAPVPFQTYLHSFRDAEPAIRHIGTNAIPYLFSVAPA